MPFINKDNLDTTKWWDCFKTFVKMDENYAYPPWQSVNKHKKW